MTGPSQPDRTQPSVEAKVDSLIETAALVKSALNRRTMIIVAALLVPLIIGAIMSIGVFRQANDIKAIVNSNNENSIDIKEALDNGRATLEAINNATGSEARARSAIATNDVIRRNVVEGDCRMRRVLALLPAPNPESSCESQTDARIYPG